MSAVEISEMDKLELKKEVKEIIEDNTDAKVSLPDKFDAIEGRTRAYIKRNPSRRTIHTDRDCPHIRNANHITVRPFGKFRNYSYYSYCDYCVSE